jgi:hypothetical protein
VPDGNRKGSRNHSGGQLPVPTLEGGLASISSDFAALSERSFQKQHNMVPRHLPAGLCNRNATVRGDLNATSSLPHISLCLYFLPILSLVYISTRFGIHDFYDHLFRGTTVPLHHVLGFESHDI